MLNTMFSGLSEHGKDQRSALMDKLIDSLEKGSGLTMDTFEEEEIMRRGPHRMGMEEDGEFPGRPGSSHERD
ncbi:MAG TPA: hypothetical protein DDW65_08200 [Firmicutes bacterium]|jgi:hypothetical protein|nr:hypothetical protein [Bacillota bacterium]